MQSDTAKTKTLSEAEIAERRAGMARGEHNAKMEGLTLSDEHADLREAYIMGEIDRKEHGRLLRQRMRARFESKKS